LIFFRYALCPLGYALPSLPVKDRIQILVFHLEDHVVRRQEFFLEKFGQPVVLFGEARLGVEFPLRFEDLFPQGRDIVAGEIQAEKGIQQVEQGLERIRLMELISI
jgi:hypothetical protein